jgi:hypothetical protein
MRGCMVFVPVAYIALSLCKMATFSTLIFMALTYPMEIMKQLVFISFWYGYQKGKRFMILVTKRPARVLS